MAIMLLASDYGVRVGVLVQMVCVMCGTAAFFAITELDMHQ